MNKKHVFKFTSKWQEQTILSYVHLFEAQLCDKKMMLEQLYKMHLKKLKRYIKVEDVLAQLIKEATNAYHFNFENICKMQIDETIVFVGELSTVSIIYEYAKLDKYYKGDQR